MSIVCTLICIKLHFVFVFFHDSYFEVNVPLLLTVDCTWSSDKVLLRDVEVLTLHHGRYTTGRRSSRVPQVKLI